MKKFIMLGIVSAAIVLLSCSTTWADDQAGKKKPVEPIPAPKAPPVAPQACQQAGTCGIQTVFVRQRTRIITRTTSGCGTSRGLFRHRIFGGRCR